MTFLTLSKIIAENTDDIMVFTDSSDYRLTDYSKQIFHISGILSKNEFWLQPYKKHFSSPATDAHSILTLKRL